VRALELLAPAKNLECGIAAIDHGADAVYIGASRFGARAAVGNSIEDIQELCEYAHPFGAKVYVTVNTILYDDELDDTRKLLSGLKKAGVDAILVQDMAIREMNDGLTLHASTQTDNRTPQKVKWLRDIGFSRVVLARELSVDEIAEIHRQVPDVELEVFVHGALCVSYSGICYASQYCFGRSANRGECAQFCRMKFSLQDADGREMERDRYLLSLKDMNQSDSLEELIAAGATSFKIEGRLKDISYVKNVTASYSLRLNEIIRKNPNKYCRSSKGICTYTFTPDLRKTFNRGYTHYFLHGRQPDIASFDTPKAMGEYVGVVRNCVTTLLMWQEWQVLQTAMDYVSLISREYLRGSVQIG
jgi:putative protease